MQRLNGIIFKEQPTWPSIKYGNSIFTGITQKNIGNRPSFKVKPNKNTKWYSQLATS